MIYENVSIWRLIVKITIKDIARNCGVGVATVSRAINGPGYVRKEIKEQILRYVENSGWQASSTALQLKTGKSKTVALIVNDILHTYNALVVNGLNRRLGEEGYQVVMSIGRCGEALDMYTKDNCVEAVFMIGLAETLSDKLAALQERGVRLICVGELWNYSGISIASDHSAGLEFLMDRFHESGHRQIAFFGMFALRTNLCSLEDCHYRSLRDMMKSLLAYSELLGVDFSLSRDTVGDCYGDTRPLEKMLEDGIHTAYICHTPELLTLFYASCLKLGIRIGRDVSVTAIGGVDTFRGFDPFPEHMRHNHEKIVDILMEVFKDPSKNSGEIRCPYIHVNGQSIAKIKEG